VSAVETIALRGLSYGVRIAPDSGGSRGSMDSGVAGAPVALLLHGFAGSGDDWAPVVRALNAEGFRTIAPDLPGHGVTRWDGAQPLARYGAEATALDLLALLDRLGVERAHWAGYSMGARLALTAALDHPDRVETLTLESVSPGIEDAAEREDRARSDEALATAIETRGAAWFAESWAARPIFESQRALPDAVRADLAARRGRNDPAGLAASLRAAGQAAQPFVGDRLGGFPRPVLLVTGELDADYVNLAAAMAPRFPASLHAVVPGAGHNVHLEKPEWFVRSLLTHLRRNTGRVPHGTTATP
jgi:2-succinyl-6-hydroxy-2,4-cyclohexadiene-1-carboxylate synthase